MSSLQKDAKNTNHMIEEIANSDIFTVDANYLKTNGAAIYLIRSNHRIAIIDTGSQSSIEPIKAALATLGLDWQAVDYIILTHIHLDHAGAASQLMKLCSKAQLVVHPKGARHMIDPQRLIDGTTAVYGKPYFDKVYGEIHPIDATRVQTSEDGSSVDLAGRQLQIIFTPGHAYHHHSIHDIQTNSVFTGDTFGVSYPSFRQGELSYFLPSTTPVQFDPEALHQSINRIMQLSPSYIYPTHFGVSTFSNTIAAQLHEQIDMLVRLTQSTVKKHGPECKEQLKDALIDYSANCLKNWLPEANLDDAKQWMKMDCELNAQGLLVWQQKQTNSH